MPRAGQIIPPHRYPHNYVVINDNTEYEWEYPEQIDNSTHMLFVFASPKGIDGSIQDITGGATDFVAMCNRIPMSSNGRKNRFLTSGRYNDGGFRFCLLV